MRTVLSDSATPERAAMSGEIRDRMEEALGELTPVERAAFVLRHFEGMGTAEIGKTLGCEPGAAKQSVFRAVRKLRKALEPLASGVISK